ncbi:hypothetical protein [Thiolapillus brandeum]|uniref:Uncharacterized protein n=1 Tax=Thiolapillus brandeum TaxID=1076588 RepID=A0A7U6JIY8_9GAMM|nr:hypothetical protein [Thiolapillus brandeum]BAO45307.1 conserved hypothetical protein [Thiolapillus brandeum]
MQPIVMDPGSTSLEQHPALVLTKRQSRKRFPEGCVTLVDSEADAIHGSRPDENLYAALVYGPSPSSEGLRLYYLVRWL